jgi:hypothetical protein
VLLWVLVLVLLLLLLLPRPRPSRRRQMLVTDSIRLTIATMGGASLGLTVPGNAMVSDVKLALHKANADVVVAAVCLFVAGAEAALPDGGRLRDLGVRNGATLFMLTHLPPHLDAQTTVGFTPFPAARKAAVVKRVLELARGGTELRELRQNYSAEGGFELPLTADWQSAIQKQNPAAAGYLKYHGARQFRFCGAPEVSALYTKDATRWWTTAEKQCLRLCMQAAIATVVSE